MEGPGSSEGMVGAGDEPVVQSLFRTGQVYEIVGEFDAGSPLIVVPDSFQGLVQAVQQSTGPPARFYLIGQSRQYLHDQGSTPVLDVDEVIPDLGEEQSARLVGVMSIVRSDDSIRDLVSHSALSAGEAVLVMPEGQPPSAFILDAEGRPQSAGLLIYRPAPPPVSLQESARHSIKIGVEDLKRVNSEDLSTSASLAVRTVGCIHVAPPPAQLNGRPIAIVPEEIKKEEAGRTIGVVPQPAPAIQVSRLPLQRGSRPSGPARIRREEVPGGKKPSLVVSLVRKLRPDAFREPVLCAYRGHPLTEPAEPCPVCGVVVCQVCRDEAGGCITVGCPNSLCRDERPNLDLGELED